DKEMRRCGIPLSFWVVNLLGRIRDFAQSGGERQRLSADLGATAISFILAASRDRHLHQTRRERTENYEQQTSNRTDTVIVTVAAEHADMRDHRDGAGNCRRDRHQERIAMPDVT